MRYDLLPMANQVVSPATSEDPLRQQPSSGSSIWNVAKKMIVGENPVASAAISAIEGEKPTTNEKSIMETERPVLGPLLGGAASLLDIPAGALNLPTYVLNELTGEKIPLPTEFIAEKTGLPDFGNLARRSLYKAIPELAPRNKWEEFGFNAIGDLMGISLLGGAGKIGKGTMLGMAIGGEAISKLAEATGGGPLTQMGAKLATHLAVPLISNRLNLDQVSKNFYETSKQEAKASIADADKLSDVYNEMADYTRRNQSSPGVPDIDAKLKDLNEIIVGEGGNPKIGVKHAIDFIQNINRTFRETKLNDLSEKFLTRLKKETYNALEGSKSSYPEAFKALELANETYKAAHTRNLVSQIVNKYPKVKQIIKSPTTKAILGITGAGGAGAAITSDLMKQAGTGAGVVGKTFGIAIPSAIALTTLDQIAKGVQTIIMSPYALNTLKKTFNAAENGMGAAFIKGATKLDKIISKEEDSSAVNRGVFRFELMPQQQ